MTDVIADAPEHGTEGLQVFSAPSNAPRVRWNTDLMVIAAVGAALAFLIIVAGEGSTLDRTTFVFVGQLPGWLLWLAQAAYVVGVLFTFGLLIGVGLFARGRLELLRDLLLAAAAAAVVVLVLTRIIDDLWPEFWYLEPQEPADTFPAFFVTTSAAIQAAASPHLTAPMRKIGWTFVLAAAAASILGGVTAVSDGVGALLVGLISAATIRYVLGTSAGLPSAGRITAGLADLGLDVDDLHYLEEQPAGAVALVATSTAGDTLFVEGLGRDSWNTRRLTRLWRQAWYQDRGAQYGSDRRQQIEHEALTLVLADRAGVSVPDLVTVGMTALDDALIVTAARDHTLEVVSPDGVDDEMLDAIWGQLGTLRSAGLSHGSLDARRVWFDAAGELSLAGFGDAAIHATDEQLHEDVASLLVTTALIVGPDRSIAAARRSAGDDAIEAMLPMLQDAALSPALRRDVRRQKLKIGALREQTAAAIGTEVPELEQLTRVTWKSVLMLAFGAFAAYVIIGGLSEVGFDTIVDTLDDARWGLVLIALVLAGSTNFTDAVALRAVSPKPVPIGVTTVEQFAIGFVNMAVPSAAGRIATNARFFQKFGINAVTSTVTGAITGFIGFIAQAILIVLTLVVGFGSIDLSELDADGSVLRLLAMAVVIFIAAAVIVYAVPPWRRSTADRLRGPLSKIGEAFKMLRSPKVVAVALASGLGTEILYGAGLATCVLATGGSVRLGEAIFVNVVVSLFAGLMPIPGGIGVSEAGLTAGLTSVGVPSEIAVAAVLIYRLVSYYLPPIWGYVCLRWLTRHDYL